MLPRLIHRYDKKSFHFYPVQNWETNWNFTGCQMSHCMIVLLPYINLLNLSWIKNVCFWGKWSLKARLTISKRLLCNTSSLFVCLWFKMWHLFVLIWSSSLLLEVPREGCASWLCYFLGIFTCIFDKLSSFLRHFLQGKHFMWLIAYILNLFGKGVYYERKEFAPNCFPFKVGMQAV